MMDNLQIDPEMADIGADNSAIDRLAPLPTKGRGAVTNRTGRFEKHTGEAIHDGWVRDEELLSPPKLETTLIKDTTKTIIARNTSPDVPFDRSINPYRGCEHGCVYCFARPTHAYLGLSPGLDFETKLFYKPEAARLLERELRKSGYQCRTMAMGTNTDPYQPVEKTLRLTRGILEVLSAFNHPVGIVTKSALVLRDLDILGPMAEKGLAQVCLSVTTLDHRLANTLEPRASTPMKRLAAIQALADAGIPCGVMAAPVIPALNDHELESILTSAHDAGATLASYILLRLPLEIAGIFKEWLETHEPNKAKHVMSLLASTRGGKVYQSEFGTRMKGTGEYAALLKKRFELMCNRLGYNDRRFELDTSQFCAPLQKDGQLALF